MDSVAPHLSATVDTFTQQLSATRRGARLGRLLAAERLRAWEVPWTVADRGEQVVAELVANAVLHGRVRGRDFRLALAFDAASGTLRIEVTDARDDRLPVPVSDPGAARDDESGRGLVLVAALADRWGTRPYAPAGKTVWADVKGPEAAPSA
jgi:anti-sigma regulatory factor (Ser/Thr protein kinase)